MPTNKSSYRTGTEHKKGNEFGSWGLTRNIIKLIGKIDGNPATIRLILETTQSAKAKKNKKKARHQIGQKSSGLQLMK